MLDPLSPQVIQWIRQYQETTSNLVTHSLLPPFDNESHSGYAQLVSQYAACTYDLLHTWVVNILQVRLPSCLIYALPAIHRQR